ncbi:MAG: glycosyltransferase family 2 protein [Alphaproteobacteria bacterium]|uniref:Glycosyltransferase family 2 protein n=1 Tax=Candidatus Nitrobium versatile TaxID=2884831 RepID=A0A953LX17_9BACT|nr:glycosyltransferase family 2 protein [Candidatus Nitrobium versatile]
MGKSISVIIPNYNGAATIGPCIEAALSSDYKNFEVIVVDDCSSDGSVEIIEKYPCTLVRLGKHGGASRARNAGALRGRGDILFFTDSDCLLTREALSLAAEAIAGGGPRVIIGGTYTPLPYDTDFFSTFQSVFIHYSETKKTGRPAGHADKHPYDSPDYLATHAMAMDAQTFRDSGGFREDFLPILEDVEFSHRAARSGCLLRMDPGILVRHIFNFTLRKSLHNAYKKTYYWILYSLENKDLLADSGTASSELKLNGIFYLLTLLSLCLALLAGDPRFLLSLPVYAGLTLFCSRNLLAAFHKAGGGRFAFLSALYYTLLYPAPVWAGTTAAVLSKILNRQHRTPRKS